VDRATVHQTGVSAGIVHRGDEVLPVDAMTGRKQVEHGMQLNEEVRAALISGHLAHLVTLEPDGSPQVTLVWVGLEGDEIVAGHLAVRRKVANMQRDPRAVLSMETGGRTANGLAEYLVIHGTARITEGGAPELLQRLAHIYLGPGVKFPPMDSPPPGYITRITPERISGVGPWQT
jgi:PPOX class probable F420-dependent enzyme